jgi:hypothetical protein
MTRGSRRHTRQRGTKKMRKLFKDVEKPLAKLARDLRLRKSFKKMAKGLHINIGGKKRRRTHKRRC